MPTPGVSRKTAKALPAEQRDGPLEPRTLSTLEAGILRWLGRNGSGSTGEIAASLVRVPADVALAVATLEKHHGRLIERRGRVAGGTLKYGLTDLGNAEHGPDA